jgi:hypothetical protein
VAVEGVLEGSIWYVSEDDDIEGGWSFIVGENLRQDTILLDYKQSLLRPEITLPKLRNAFSI